ncbi:MAG TPA: hypothetical protein VFG95_10655 [Nitrospiria bacterium]|nr:hypothetical protein [Nitrospiria bacterium]
MTPSTALLLFLLWLLPLPAWGASPDNLFVSDIAVDPRDSNVIYVTTNFSIGVLKSIDGGKSWNQVNQGLRSYAETQIVFDPSDPELLYLGEGCAGLFISRDGGRTWIERNDGLQNSEIGILVPHPTEPGSIFAITTRGVHKAEKWGERWVPFNQNDTFTQSLEFIDLLALPTRPVTFYVASGRGLYKRNEGDSGWVSAGEPFAGKQISALAYDSKTSRLFVGVYRRGTRETLKEGGLFSSDDGGKHWSRLGTGLEQTWIRMIVADPGNPKVLYLATSGRGILKSVDGGKTWKETNEGIDDPNKDIRVLVIDPSDSKTFYAGSYGHWIYRSDDAGKNWHPLPIGPHQSTEALLADLDRTDELAQNKGGIVPPPSFRKCNECHGWTDPLINAHKGSWRVAANRREWGPSVKRMEANVSLSPKEEKEIIEFLNAYTRGKGRKSSGDHPSKKP